VTPNSARILLVADTHLGFDMPFRPRIQRRRRGHDFFANFTRALQPALEGQVDLVVHGGDLLYRSKVPPVLVEMAMAPLVKVADHGVPVYIVPGNHERSRIPLHLWAMRPNLHIFDRPRTFLCPAGKGTIALSGFPFTRKARDVFGELVEATKYRGIASDAHVLCMHQTVEGAQVGPSDYTFRGGHDVIRGKDIPAAFSAILCGHIHRAQTLTHDLAWRPLGAPVIYPGSIERTSFAERFEGKHYVIVTLKLSGSGSGRVTETSFVPLPARPMVNLVLEARDLSSAALSNHLKDRLSTLDPDAIVRVQLQGRGADEARKVLSATRLRELAPPTMNISLARDQGQYRGGRN
jgi:exonuclease SbcD